MVSFSTAFKANAAVAALFCLPNLIVGNDEMVKVFSSGTATNNPMLNHILCIDWIKNVQWAVCCLGLASCSDTKTQKTCALSFMGMMSAALFTLVKFPPSGTFELPPPVAIYMGVTFPLYTLAIMGAGKSKKA
ncbi:hypothetical protein TrCOL_g5607 [Triparma columacea]|uniref:Uncharacterized protein n=1 Tax=Triparma columacea TaxID=722753 RepID=A0A9W7GDA6_9STRA|nr:hypothetical protein TrCOL_g5607 [Triparma columacea]